MSSAAEKLKEYPTVQTSKDGRQYVKIGDVLNSSAGRAEIRRQAETQIPISTNVNGNGNNEGRRSEK
ncbi:MAG TPA: hypothetical protein VGN86_17280 [Pyrinomonadaceae bacterium]|jgi:hypothetical protein|nr:hypothetical protein [Pyrinomonadaceae bacterium]